MNELANAADISSTAVRSWLSILEASGIVRLLEPLHINPTKRMVKAPKLYMMDTGLAAWLGGWSSPDVLERGAMAGAMFETFVVGEIIKGYLNQARVPVIGFYRDRDGHEVDLLTLENNTVSPIEIKLTASPDVRVTRRLLVADKLGVDQGAGAIVCMTDVRLPLAENVSLIPAGLL